MSENDNDGIYGESPAETTSVFRADFLQELDNSATSQTSEAPVSGSVRTRTSFRWSTSEA